MSDPNQAPLAERRQNPELRALFEEAYARVEACFDPKQTWGGLPLEHFACRILSALRRSSEPCHLTKGAIERHGCE